MVLRMRRVKETPTKIFFLETVRKHGQLTAKINLSHMKTVLLQKDKRSILLSVTDENSAKSPKGMPGVRCTFCSRLQRKTFVLEVSYTRRIRNKIPRTFR